MQRPLYFEAIPSEVVSLLLQYLGTQPHSEQWIWGVETVDIYTALSTGGALTTAAREQFECSLYEELMVNEPNRLADLVKLAAALAPQLKRLYFGSPIAHLLKFDEFRALCVLKLDISVCEGATEQLLTVCGDSLRELRIHSTSDSKKNESMLRLLANYCRSIEVLDFGDMDYDYPVEVFWRSVGGTLRELHGRIPVMEFIHINRHCSHLEMLNLKNMAHIFTGNTYIRIPSVLPTLRDVSFPILGMNVLSINVDRIEAFLANCSPELRIHTGLNISVVSEFRDYIRIMGLKLCSLALRGHYEPFPDELPLLANLEKLSIELFDNITIDGSVVTELFTEPMPKLRNLILFRVPSPKILASLANSVTNLQEFKWYLGCSFGFGFTKMPVKGSDFADFLKANQKLQRICVNFGVSHVDNINFDTAAVKEIADLIRHLHVCPVLREVRIYVRNLELNRHQEILRNACMALRRRRVDVMVNYQCFLPVPKSA